MKLTLKNIIIYQINYIIKNYLDFFQKFVTKIITLPTQYTQIHKEDKKIYLKCN